MQGQASLMHIIRGDDPRIENIAVQMHIDRATSNGGTKPFCQTASGFDVRNTCPVNQLLFERVEIALAHEHNLIKPKACAEARLPQSCWCGKGKASQIPRCRNLWGVQVCMGIEPHDTDAGIVFCNDRQSGKRDSAAARRCNRNGFARRDILKTCLNLPERWKGGVQFLSPAGVQGGRWLSNDGGGLPGAQSKRLAKRPRCWHRQVIVIASSALKYGISPMRHHWFSYSSIFMCG
ncbi:hypothetical protein GCM10016455_30880 [Aliiroseovarius zhejiangensis]|uniref:Transposase n=1 Tax=Aliiroseovarius zhejiangensis TaxID=1632025 RepID=A0ABQ3JB00_9RHOB|nr:hypothetical protein GCM10016455_30880 [Aliiroseovarius zhejiangensis]